MEVRVVNPLYICFLLSNIYMFRDFDEAQTGGFIFQNIDFENKNHIDILLDELIKPEFMRLSDLTKESIEGSLYYANNFSNKKFFSIIMECLDVLDMSEDIVYYFLKKLELMSFNGRTLNFDEKDIKVSFKPLRDNQVSYISSGVVKKMSDIADSVYMKILGS